MQNTLKWLTAVAFIAFTCSSTAQTPVTGKSLATSLGVVVFPAKNQTAEKQSQDEQECFNWSKTQTGFDPKNPSATVQATPPAEPEGGQRLRGAARGAAAGAVIGEIADDDASKGAGIGAAAGVLKGGAEKRRQRKEAEQHAEQQHQTAIQEQASLFNKGFGACLESKGYTVK